MNFAYAQGLAKQDLEKDLPRVDEAPFDSSRKMMSTIHDRSGSFVQYTKGAPDEILRRCTGYVENGQTKPMTEEKMAQILAANKPNFGFDAQNEVYVEDMIAAGIVDPTKVTRSALENAASVAEMVLTTESLVADLPEPPAAPAAGGDMGGMGGMY